MRSLILLSILALPMQAQIGWTPLPNTGLTTSGMCASGTSGSCANVIEAWSGAVADTSRNRLILFGGGHGDYNGNEVYAIYPPGTTPSGVACSSATAPAICRIKEPSVSLRSLGGACFPDEPDGVTPNGRHTYGGLAYVADRDKMYVHSGSVACANGSHYGDTWTLDLPTLAWALKDPATLVGGSTKPRDICTGCGSTGQGPWSNAVYDPVRRLVFMQTAFFSSNAGATMWSYSDATNTYTQLTTSLPMPVYGSWVVDPKRHRLYMIGANSGAGAGDATASLGTPWMSYVSIATGSSYTSTAVTAPSCDGLAGAPYPGLDYDPVLDRIVGWPNFGNTVYLFDPASGTCTSQTFSGGPPDSRNASNAVYTTGTHGRFRYFPALDAFVVTNDGNTNAYLLRLPSNSITVKNTGSTTTNYPVQIGRPFKQGEIPLGQFPQASVDGASVPTQVDVKARWADNSLKHAVVSFLIPTFTSGTTYAVSFVAGTTVGNTALTQAQMLDAAYNFDAKITLVKGVTKTASARTMLAAGDYTAWASGPIATTILLGNHAQGTTCGGNPASAYDLGYDSFCPFRPLFQATFWPNLNKVYVRFVGEIANTEQFENIVPDSMSLTVGSASPTTVYSRSTALTMYAGSRWTKTAWIGGTPPAAAYNHNLAYLTNTKAIPNYDSTRIVPEADMASAYTSWQAASKDLYDAGEWQKIMGNAGGRPDIGPYPTWVVRWLYSGDIRMQEEALGNADLATGWAMHFREGKAGKYLDRSGAVSGLGRVLSTSNRKTLCFFCGYSYTDTLVADRIVPVGTVTTGGWTPDAAHQPDTWTPLYTVTGDYFYLEQALFWASWTQGAANGAATNSQGRGPDGSYGGLPGYGSLQTRGQAWAFRSRVNTAFITPDAMPEKAYLTQLANDAIAIWEGQRGVSGSAFAGNTAWTWGSTRTPWDLYFGMGVPPLHHWDAGDSTFAAQYPSDPAVTDIAVSTWEQNFVIFALGRGRELGFATNALLSWVGSNLISQATDATYNPWLLGAYRLPMTSVATGTYFTNWAGVKSGFETAAQNATSFAPVYSGGDCTNNPSDCYAYFAGAAMSMVADQTDGTTAWAWVTSNIQNHTELNSDPKWAIIPRAFSCSITPLTIGPYSAGQVVAVTFTAHNCAAPGPGVQWSMTGLEGSGLSLSASTGVLSGTPVAGTYNIVVSYDTANHPITLTISSGRGIWPLPFPVR